MFHMKIQSNFKKGGYSTEIASNYIGLPPFTVKFENEVTLPNYMSVITFDHLEACEVRYDVYFKASDLKEVK